MGVVNVNIKRERERKKERKEKEGTVCDNSYLLRCDSNRKKKKKLSYDNILEFPFE